MPSMNVSLTTELMEAVQSKVRSGMYNNASEVVREALRAMELQTAFRATQQLEQLRHALAPGIAQADKGQYAAYDLERLMAGLSTAD